MRKSPSYNKDLIYLSKAAELFKNWGDGTKKEKTQCAVSPQLCALYGESLFQRHPFPDKILLVMFNKLKFCFANDFVYSNFYYHSRSNLYFLFKVLPVI
jgi:hypothetical protein